MQQRLGFGKAVYVSYPLAVHPGGQSYVNLQSERFGDLVGEELSKGTP